MRLRLDGFSILGVFLAGLLLDLGRAGNVITRRLRFCVSVKLSLFTFYAVLTPLSYVNNKVTGLIYGKLRFPAISN
jgi:hypothetical protein